MMSSLRATEHQYARTAAKADALAGRDYPMSTHGTKLTIANVCSLVRYATRFRIPRADSQLAAGVLI